MFLASVCRAVSSPTLPLSSLAMTMRYAHLAPEHLRMAVSRLEGLTRIGPTKVLAQGLAQEPLETEGASQKSL